MVLRRTKMNLGFYVKSGNAEGVNGKIYMCLNEAIANKSVKDASVFFDNIDYNPMKTNFGMFNSTDIWHFTGELITTSIETTVNALKAVNRFNLSYLYTRDDIDVLKLIDISSRVNVIVDSETDSDHFYRLTGKKPKLLKDFTVESFAEVV
tara:strand:+ start:25148 stop:25600 length:453 start_codon:yes stop_codon:yes gene_type:complete